MATNKKGSKRTAVTVILLILTIVVVIIAMIIAVLFWKPFDNQQGGIYIPDETDATTQNDNIVFDDIINFLVVGLDESESLTDVIMVMSVNSNNKSVEILQIPRDSYVSQTISTGKINGIYNFGEKNLQPIQRLIKVIYQQFKLKIDYYGIFTLEAFRNSVDAMGGIPIDMPNKLVYDPSKIIPAGYQILNGEQAEWLVRHRSSYLEGDIGRIKAQRLFLASAVERIKDLGIFKITTSILPEIYNDISSNMSVMDVVSFARQFLDIDMENIRIHMVPGEGMMHKGQSVWAIHVDETVELLNTYFRNKGDDVSLDELELIDIGKTGDWYENTDNNFDDLLNGQTPGKKNYE